MRFSLITNRLNVKMENNTCTIFTGRNKMIAVQVPYLFFLTLCVRANSGQ